MTTDKCEKCGAEHGKRYLWQVSHSKNGRALISVYTVVCQTCGHEWRVKEITPLLAIPPK
jgi:DNA-directed RNA polymerase subunit M/transcription elongation factor TFIIS